MRHPKPVIILTGFLGVGKTTLLNAILRHQKKHRFAIIENEIGEISIDSELIINNTGSFTELSNGCICCSINNNLIDTLRTLSKRGDWDVLIIEATGVANPGGIILPFKQLPWTQKYFQLPNVICIVDAQNVEKQLKVSDTSASQLAYSDKIYLNKTDLVSNDQLKQTQIALQKINPFSRLFFGNKNEIPIDGLIKKSDSLKPIIQFATPINTHQNDLKHDHFDAISLNYNIPFDENKLFSRLHTFLVAQSVSVYRFKGIFYDPRKEKKLIIQSVMQSLHIEEGKQWTNDELKESKFVFIGKNLLEKGFDRMLKNCQYKP